MLTPDFKEFAALLNSNAVEFRVVGSFVLAAQTFYKCRVSGYSKS